MDSARFPKSEGVIFASPFGQWSQPEELMKANRSYARSVRSLILKRIMKHMKRL